MERERDPGELPEKIVEVDQIVAYNMRRFRRAADLTQEELGLRIGWSGANVSAAERSADSDRDRRRFDARTLAALSLGLGVPVVALFLPPSDDGTRARYLFRACEQDEGSYDMGDLMARVVMPDNDDETPVSGEYRGTFNRSAEKYLDPHWAARAGKWLEAAETPELRAARAARLRESRDELMRAAGELDDLASAIDPAGKAAS